MKKLSAIFPILFLVSGATMVHGAERIGVASIVKNSVTGTIGGRTAGLRPGDSVFHRERIAAGSNGKAQFIFVDETVFNIGANAKVTLDEFIYNPRRRTGRIVLNVTKGAFRFISGSAKPSTYSIKTPVATLGVRGTIFSGNVLSSTSLTLNLRQGSLLICPTLGSQLEGRSGNQRRRNSRSVGDCSLVTPGEYRVGTGVGNRIRNDFVAPNTDPVDAADALQPQIRCVVSRGIQLCF